LGIEHSTPTIAVVAVHVVEHRRVTGAGATSERG
jgi:hypothetical protein